MNIIFTNHAEERRRKRKIVVSDVEKTLSNPDKSFPGKKSDTVKFIRTINGRQHQVIGKYLQDQKAWLILSVWVRGEDDHNWITDLASLIGKAIGGTFRLLFQLFKK